VLGLGDGGAHYGMIVAASIAQFGLPEPKRGLMPDFGGAFPVARVAVSGAVRRAGTLRPVLRSCRGQVVSSAACGVSAPDVGSAG